MPRNPQGHVTTLLAQCCGCLDIFEVEALVTGRRIITVFPNNRVEDVHVKYRQHHYMHLCNGHRCPISFF